MPGNGWTAPTAQALAEVAAQESATGTFPSAGLLPRGRMTPECRTGADKWPDLHELCHAPGYQDRVLGWVKVPCACTCHELAETEVEP